METNRVVTYSLLAHINNSQLGIKDFSDIFIPLVKRVLSLMNSENYNRGKDIGEIKTKVDHVYHLDIPYPFLKKILQKIAKEVNQEGEIKFQIYADGGFIIKSFVFADYESEVHKQEKDVQYIDDLYSQFLQINNTSKGKEPSIFDFIDKSRGSLIKHFAERNQPDTEVEFSLQAKFIVTFKDNTTVYGILRRIYLGSIISSYLEFKTEGKSLHDQIEFVLDTNFMIGLLDLTTVEATHTCRKIVDICKSLGYRVSVLDFTIDETKELIHRTAENYATTFLAKRINPESLYNACDRRELTQTDLQRIASNLERIIPEEFGIYIVPETTKFRNEAKYSHEYENFKKFRVNEWSALHDATAVKYIQYKRAKKVRDFYDAKCWFVTNPHHETKFFGESGFLSEIITADELVNILWLTNPNLKANIPVDEFSEIGLSRLISSTLSASLPSARIIKELDQNIQKYAKDNLTDDEIIRVAKRIAKSTNENLQQINSLASKDALAFVERLHQVAKSEQLEQLEFEEKLKTLMFKIKSHIEERAAEREKGIVEEFKTKEAALNSRLRDEMQSALANQKKQQKMEVLTNFESAFKLLEKSKHSYEKRAEHVATIQLGLLVIPPLAILTFLYFRYNWDASNSVLVAVIVIVIEYLYFAITKKEWSLKAIWDDLREKLLRKYHKQFSFDLTEYKAVQEKIDLLRNELKDELL